MSSSNIKSSSILSSYDYPSSYDALSKLIGVQNVDNLEHLYKKYDFLSKEEFLNFLKIGNPNFSKDSNHSQLCLDFDFDAQLKIARLDRPHILTLFKQHSKNTKKKKKIERSELTSQIKSHITNMSYNINDEVIDNENQVSIDAIDKKDQAISSIIIEEKLIKEFSESNFSAKESYGDLEVSNFQKIIKQQTENIRYTNNKKKRGLFQSSKNNNFLGVEEKKNENGITRSRSNGREKKRISRNSRGSIRSIERLRQQKIVTQDSRNSDWKHLLNNIERNIENAYTINTSFNTIKVSLNHI